MGPHLMKRPPKYVHGFIDRHGKPRFYFRRAGFKKVPLPGLPWSSQFMEAYEQAIAGQSASIDVGFKRLKIAYGQGPHGAGFRTGRLSLHEGENAAGVPGHDRTILRAG
jgi:hypothetical protein